MKDTISLAIICKNEESCIERCIKSVNKYVDEIVVVDTGSIDRTVEIVKKYTKNLHYYKCKNEWSFSEARNYTASKCKSHWILFLDADEYMRDKDIKSLVSFLPEVCNDIWEVMLRVYAMGNDENTPEIIHYNSRLYRNGKNIKWEGAIHNRLVVHGERKIKSPNIVVVHDKRKKSRYELKIRDEQRHASIEKYFLKEAKIKDKKVRSLYYLGNYYRDYNMFVRAIDTYTELINSTFNIQLLYQAGYYRADCYFQLKSYEKAEKDLRPLIDLAKWRAESYILLSQILILRKNYQEAIKYLDIAKNLQIPDSDMFLDGSCYFYLPYHLLAIAYSFSGDMNLAMVNIDKALKYEPGKFELVNFKLFLESQKR